MFPSALFHPRFTPVFAAVLAGFLAVPAANVFAHDDSERSEIDVVASIYLVSAASRVYPASADGEPETPPPLPEALRPIAEEVWGPDGSETAHVSSVVRLRGKTGSQMHVSGPLPGPEYPDARLSFQYLLGVAPLEDAPPGRLTINDLNLSVSLSPDPRPQQPPNVQGRRFASRPVPQGRDDSIGFMSRAQLTFGQPELLVQTYFGPDADPVLLIIQVDEVAREDVGT